MRKERPKIRVVNIPGALPLSAVMPDLARHCLALVEEHQRKKREAHLLLLEVTTCDDAPAL